MVIQFRSTSLPFLRHLRFLQQLSGIIIHFRLHEIGIAEILVQTRMLHKLKALLVELDLL